MGKLIISPPITATTPCTGVPPAFNRGIWERVGPSSTRSIRLKYVSADADQGFPGQLTMWVTYTLTDTDELKITYEARTSAPTIVNLTNHSYFNLGGAGMGDVSQESISVQASSYTPVDADGVPPDRAYLRAVRSHIPALAAALAGEIPFFNNDMSNFTCSSVTTPPPSQAGQR